ncbi:hypothetical protein F4774DRAFT_376996 [Daldinia eschscholtzii]|nr:hypothetical protein F4774DRAFT_376996 [Daldinia eschscholtzii]
MPPIPLRYTAVPNIPIVGAFFSPLIKKFVEEATARVVTKIFEQVDLMPFLPNHIPTERNLDKMPDRSTTETARRQQLMRRSRSVGSEPLQPEPELNANTTNDSDAKKGDGCTRECCTGSVTVQNNITNGPANIMSQSGVEGIGHGVLNHDGSSRGILNSLFNNLVGAALIFFMFKLLESRGTS